MPMTGLVLRVIFSVCAAGADPDICRHHSSAVEATIAGPLVRTDTECAYAAFPFLASLQANGDPRFKDKVITTTCERAGEGEPPTAPYGVIGRPEFKRAE